MCYTICMGDFFSQSQVQSQKQAQIQTLSQQQLHALKILSMDTNDLRDEIADALKDNPFLVSGDKILQKDFSLRDKTKSSSNVSHASQKSSDAFQAIIEQKEDTRETLKEHLLHQLHMERLTPAETRVGEKLIHNLDQHGHHVLEPATLLAKNDADENLETLEKCIKLIQSFDPAGTCTKNVEESLLVQAEQNPDADALSMFILDGHLDFINPPVPSRTEKKIRAYIESLKNLFGLSEKEKSYMNLSIGEEDVRRSIDFIRTLTPYPAAGFSSDEIHLISPDIYVTEIPETDLDTDPENEKILIEKKILKINGRYWKIQVQNSNIPEISVIPDIQNLDAQKKELKSKIAAAKEFVEMLENRKSTIEKSAWEIVKAQHRFFENGTGHLAPFRLKDLAAIIGVSESTVSRMANGKYLQYKGSVYPLKYFFENSISAPAQTEQDGEQKSLSRDNVQLEIKKILEEHNDDKKKLSDQKITDILEERGIKIARRTVAKYRGQLNIESSYDR